MSDQKPSVGRIVHYYGKPPLWDCDVDGQPGDRHAWGLFDGPFAATVVCVLPNGNVNLHVTYPHPLIITTRACETVSDVPENAEGPAQTGYWCWPPRV